MYTVISDLPKDDTSIITRKFFLQKPQGKINKVKPKQNIDK